MLNVFGRHAYEGTFFVRDKELVEASSITQDTRKDTEGSTKAIRVNQGTGNWWVLD